MIPQQQYFGTSNPVLPLESKSTILSSTTPIQQEDSIKRVQYYLKMYQQIDKLSKKKIKQLIQKGIPKQIRWMYWLKLSHASIQQKSSPHLFQQLVEQSTEDAEQIKKDIPRTFPNLKEFTEITNRMRFERKHKQLGNEFEQNNQQKLYNVCIALSIYMKKEISEESGYVQGWSFIIGYFLMHLSEEDTFWICVQLLQKYNFKAMYEDGFPKLKQCISILDQLVCKYYPQCYQLLVVKNGLDLNLLTHKWFLTLFCLQFPFLFLDVFWDAFFLHGWKFVFKVVLQLIATNMSTMMTILKDTTMPMEEQNSNLIELFHSLMPKEQFETQSQVDFFFKKVFATKLSDKYFDSLSK